MNYATIEEIAAKWGITTRQVRSYCANNRIPGATLEQGEWRIPANATKPERKRRRTFPTTILGVLEAERSSRISGGLYHRLQIDITPFVIAENFKQFYYLGLQDWRRGSHARLRETCRTGQDVFILGLRQFGHQKLAEKAIAEQKASEAFNPSTF